jgi:hypothetical protein
MEIEIYTFLKNPFALGNAVTPIKTKVKEYEVIDLGYEKSGIVVTNPYKCLYHVVEPECGAIVGTSHDKAEIIDKVRKDVEASDEEILKQQIEQGKKDRDDAKLEDNKNFFTRFNGEYHEWGIDSQHSNEYCKNCYANKPVGVISDGD